MNTVWDILYLRRPVLNYVSPPVCEVIFSGSSNPVIVLSERPIGQVTGLVLGGFGNFRLSWNAFPGALCYNVYRLSGEDVYEILAQCVPDTFFDLIDSGTYVVTPITLEGEGPISDPIIFNSGGGGGTSTVNVVASCPQTSRNGFPGTFMIYREPGDTIGNLIVNFTLTGTAVNGDDYDLIPLSATIPNGSSSVFVEINPDDVKLVADKVATLTITPSLTYAVGPDNTDVVLLRHPLLRVVDYGGSAPLFTPPADAGAVDFCEWDGTFSLFDDGTPNDTWWFQDSQGTFIQPEISIQGKALFFAFVSGPFNSPAPNTFQLSIQAISFSPFEIKPVWEGIKIGGANEPSGVYDWNGNTNCSDQRLTVSINI